MLEAQFEINGAYISNLAWVAGPVASSTWTCPLSETKNYELSDVHLVKGMHLVKDTHLVSEGHALS